MILDEGRELWGSGKSGVFMEEMKTKNDDRRGKNGVHPVDENQN
ncbi:MULTISPECIES: hypothetical protein [Niallia]|uniref:Uncharacterized protein n=1 Tax=Niallia hominis TaxID=3133173 RepID=A0ABV1F326_9BACI|nr:hypothetical protein [Niallia sp. MER TA 168]